MQRGREPKFTLENRSGYDTGDLRRFFGRGLAAMGIRRPKRIVVVASPIRTRGCAQVARDRAGTPIVIAIASPGRFSLAKLAQIFQHECAHAKGYEHEAMPERRLWSEGGMPWWAIGMRVRYRGRAPNQVQRLKGSGR